MTDTDTVAIYLFFVLLFSHLLPKVETSRELKEVSGGKEKLITVVVSSDV